MTISYIKSLSIIITILIASACMPSTTSTQNENQIETPRELYGALFTDVLNNDSLFGKHKFFGDSKDFMDCTPKREMSDILSDYKKLSNKNSTSCLKQFLLENFDIPSTHNTPQFSDSSDINTHIKTLWKVLRRSANNQKFNGTLLPLQHDYIVPGGRFREIYYWDSYFTMLGLFADGEIELVENMINNFADMITHIGFIPNGNRSYYASRSQPPFFSYMVEAFAEYKSSDSIYVTYLNALQAEYNFWMKGNQQLSTSNKFQNHCVRMHDGEILNRYYDSSDTPREEMYRNDVETAKQLKEINPNFNEKELFRNLRSGAESGWDFSSRWLKDYDNLYSIHTTDIIPIDLNCLMYHLECTLSKCYAVYGDKEKAKLYTQKSENRKNAIIKYLWNKEANYFMDYDIIQNNFTNNFSLAGIFPLFARIAQKEQAEKVAKEIQTRFLKDGGVVTTLYHTGQQWDYPNGWAPLQWITYKGLKNYSYDKLADEIKKRWTQMVEYVYSETGKLLEKYDVVNVSTTGGGEYPNQDGFGWTNGVYRAFCTSK